MGAMKSARLCSGGSAARLHTRRLHVDARRRRRQIELNSVVEGLALDLPEPDRKQGHRYAGVSAATLGYGYRLPPPVDRFMDRRFG